jgi:hypothetical protein
MTPKIWSHISISPHGIALPRPVKKNGASSALYPMLLPLPRQLTLKMIIFEDFENINFENDNNRKACKR